MAVKFTRPRGTMDVLPGESWKWQYLEDWMRKVVARYSYHEIRLPTFESTELFSRGVGEETDIVSKEMYTFEDKGGRSITLRPEGTAGVVRAVLENGLLASSPLPLKNYYLQSCFRYEKAQKGRFREFHQFGIECFGTHAPEADVEAMAVADSLWRAFSLSDKIHLEINSVGCPVCRPHYIEKLQAYFREHEDKLCDTCKERLDKNPMRILDCKNESCAKIAEKAPSMLDYLCEDCSSHFEKVKQLLGEADMPFTVNAAIVRGLDYYTNTVFEFIAQGVGTQGTVCGGGRYDGLIAQLGGQPTPAVGFALGIERLLMLLEENGKLPQPPAGPDVYLVAMGDEPRAFARKLATRLRGEGHAIEVDIAARSIKAQMKAAGRLNATYTMVLGDEELSNGQAVLKRMADGAEVTLELADIENRLLRLLVNTPFAPQGQPLEALLNQHDKMK
ncbi:MAG: histidine--tRNA ligase [Oscillospiraceae bacterium]